MKVVFYVGDRQRDRDLAVALSGCFDVTQCPDNAMREGFDLHCIIGLRHKRIRDQLVAAGRSYLYWDKAFDRNKWPKMWRFSVCEQQPSRHLMNFDFPSDRAFNGGRFRPWRSHGGSGHVLIGGWSAKASDYFDIPSPEIYVRDIITALPQGRDILYRAKPSYRGAHSVAGAKFSDSGRRSIERDLRDAVLLITYASGTCLDAMIAGVPSIVLGPGSMASISSTSLDDARKPILASDDERFKALSNLGYFQWSLDEMANGSARGSIRSIIEKCIGERIP